MSTGEGDYPGGKDSDKLKIAMELTQIEKISKALADETRLMIFQAIAARKNMNCGEIVNLRGVTPATVSHHLKVLADAGLIECRRQGQFVHNRAIPKTLAEYARALTHMARGRKSSTHRAPRKREGGSRVLPRHRRSTS